MGTYFLNSATAYQEALQQKRMGPYNDLQICYYHGEPLNSDLPNLINLPLEHIYDFMSETDYRMISTFREEDLDPETNAQIIGYIEASQKKAILKKAEFKELFKQEVRKIKLDFSEPLRIFFITSRTTTVLQHCAKSLKDAFDDMGYETFLSIEYNDMQNWGMNQDNSYFVWHLKNMLDFKPHIVINLDYLHNDFLPDEMFNFVWFQDIMPVFNNNKEHVHIRKRDFIYYLVKGFGDAMSQTGIKSEYQGFLINEKIFTKREEIKKEKKIVFIGSSYHHHLKEIKTDAMFNQIFEEMVKMFEEKNCLSNYDIVYFVQKYNKPGWYIGEIYTYISRDYCVEKLCKINTGEYKVEIYGAGWEQNEYVNKFYKGMVKYGKDICKIYNGATYGYCVGGYVLMQRTLECAFSGTIPLVLDVRMILQDEYDKKVEDGIQFFNIKELENILTSYKQEEKDFSFIQKEYCYKKFATRIINTVQKELSQNNN